MLRAFTEGLRSSVTITFFAGHPVTEPYTQRMVSRCITSSNGDESEAEFIVRAVQHGFIVSKPFGGWCAYDAVLDNGKRLFRVQVKSCRWQRKGGGEFVVKLRQGARKKGYTSELVDVIAMHVVPLDTWYIIPIQKLGRVTTVSLRPHLDAISRFNQFEGAWHIFDEP